MIPLQIGSRSYEVDEMGFLLDPNEWDEAFAEGMARDLGIPQGLTEAHWAIIRFIRREFGNTGQCPLVFTTCRANHLSLRELEALFPSGYLRGACILAGLSYRSRRVDFFGGRGVGETPRAKRTVTDETAPASAGPPPATVEKEGIGPKPPTVPIGKVYRIDRFGFLVDPEEWDEEYAANRAWEMKLPGGLTERRWEILRYLRGAWATSGTVPTLLQCCRDLRIELEEMEALFPDGYHRGAVKLAGLCVRGR